MEFRNIDNRLKAGVISLVMAILYPCGPLYSQQADIHLFRKFKERFSLLDSLISAQTVKLNSTLVVAAHMEEYSLERNVDSLLQNKIEDQKAAMKAETGLLISGQTYYRLDENLGYDDENALSRYRAKMQVELRWNFLSSSLVKRESRLDEINVRGELEQARLQQERIRELTEKQKEFFQFEYDSLLTGVLRLRIDNLKLLSQVQEYLVSDRSIATDELLKIMDEQAVAERQLAAIPKEYPLASQLSRPGGSIIQIDTAALKKYIARNDITLRQAQLEIELLGYREESSSYWRTLNISPFVRYSYYVRPTMDNSANVDAGVAFQIPLSTQTSKERKALRAERMQKLMEKEDLAAIINTNVDKLLVEIERANKGLKGEMERIGKMKGYLALRKENYKGHIGEYNYIDRIKEYNHYLTCWENYFRYQYTRDCCIAELQNYLPGCSVMEFCRITN